MAREMKKADVQKYLKQAGEFLAAAIQSYESERYNAATFNAIQAMLNANDALTINHLGQRASSDHREALALHAGVAKILNDNSQKIAPKPGIGPTLKRRIWRRHHAGARRRKGYPERYTIH